MRTRHEEGVSAALAVENWLSDADGASAQVASLKVNPFTTWFALDATGLTAGPAGASVL